MGVSQSVSVLDQLLASGSVGGKRNLSNSNQAMFDVALKGASAAMPQASGRDKRSEQDVAADQAELKGKAIPQNGKDIPANRQDQQVKAASEPSSNKSSAVPDKNSAASDKSSAVSDNSSAASDKSSAASDKNSAVSDKSAVLTDDLQTAKAGINLPDSVGHKVEGESADFPGLSPKEPLADLERLLDSEGLSLTDIRDYLDQEGLLSAERFDELLSDPEALLAQLQTLLQSDKGLVGYLRGLGAGTDLLAQLPAAFSRVVLRSSGELSEGVQRFSDVLKSEISAESKQADNLVSQLLKERGSVREGGSGLERDKLFEQLLGQKSVDANKVSGFSGLPLKDGVGANFASGLAAVAGAGASVGHGGTGAESMQSAAQRAGLAVPLQPLAQLPVLRGLPGQPGATEALNERIMMMRAKGIQTAEIRLDPPDLGKLEIRVRVSGEGTSIQFHSPNPSVREALESQVNRLREMMSEAGVNLGQVDVSDQSFSGRGDEAYASSGDGRSAMSGVAEDEGEGEGEEGELSPPSAVSQGSAVGVVDYFA